MIFRKPNAIVEGSIATLSMLVLSLLLLSACTSKPLPGGSGSDRNRGASAQTDSREAPSRTARPGNAPAEAKSAGSGSDLDKIAREAEADEAKKLLKPAEPITLPAGTRFYVHLDTEVGSKISKSGDDFRGSLAAPVAFDKRVVIPAGTIVSGRVVQAKRAGRFKGGAILALELRSILLHDRKILIHTQMVTTESTGKGKRSTGLIAGGTAGGAAIGAVAGGGKGAAIGTAVGAVTGTTTAAFTGKRDISLPVESLVAFRLSDPIELAQDVKEIR